MYEIASQIGAAEHHLAIQHRGSRIEAKFILRVRI